MIQMPWFSSSKTRQRMVGYLGLTAAVFVLAFAGIALTRESGRVASIWLANGIVVLALLKSPQRLWPGWPTWPTMTPPGWARS